MRIMKSVNGGLKVRYIKVYRGYNGKKVMNIYAFMD